MIYVLQHSYKTEYNNFSDEIQGRKEYLYDIFKTYFIIKHTDYSIDNFLHPNYYILENFPSNIWEKYYFIVGDTDFVIRYIKSKRKELTNKILIVITCKKNNNSFFIIDFLYLKICIKIYGKIINAVGNAIRGNKEIKIPNIMTCFVLRLTISILAK